MMGLITQVRQGEDKPAVVDISGHSINYKAISFENKKRYDTQFFTYFSDLSLNREDGSKQALLRP